MIYRVYFNSRADFPLVWSIDDGTQATERLVRQIEIHGCTIVARTLSMARWSSEPCPCCGGLGHMDEDCSLCRGQNGKVTLEQATLYHAGQIEAAYAAGTDREAHPFAWFEVSGKVTIDNDVATFTPVYDRAFQRAVDQSPVRIANVRCCE